MDNKRVTFNTNDMSIYLTDQETFHKGVDEAMRRLAMEPPIWWQEELYAWLRASKPE